MTLKQHSRRIFLKKSLALATAGAVPYFGWSPTAFANRSANDRPRIGCIGLGDMATNFDAPQHATFGDILAVCDVDSRHAERAKFDPKIGKGKADSYGDYRNRRPSVTAHKPTTCPTAWSTADSSRVACSSPGVRRYAQNTG